MTTVEDDEQEVEQKNHEKDNRINEFEIVKEEEDNNNFFMQSTLYEYTIFIFISFLKILITMFTIFFVIVISMKAFKSVS